MKSKRPSTGAPKKQSRSRKPKRRPWTPQEDAAIIQLVALENTRQWSIIAEKLSTAYKISGRTGKQCRERWHNHLDPAVNKTPWGLDEEMTLFEKHTYIGNKWAEIATLLPGRSDNSIKNRYYSTLKKEFRKVYGFDGSRDELKHREQELCGLILTNIQNKARTRLKETFDYSLEKFYENSDSGTFAPPDLPRLMPIEISPLLITGFHINTPNWGVPVVEEESLAEFMESAEPATPSEVLVMPKYHTS